MIIANYIPCENCQNSDVAYTCCKCGKYGREFALRL